MDVDPGDVIEPIMDIATAGLDDSSNRRGGGDWIIFLTLVTIAIIIVWWCATREADAPPEPSSAVEVDR